jgi:hypothetical protein
MNEIDYKNVIDSLAISVEQAKSFVDNAKKTFESIKLIESAIGEEIRNQELAMKSMTDSISNQLIDVLGKTNLLTQKTENESKKVIGIIEKIVDDSIKQISLSVDMGIGRIKDEMSSLTKKSAMFEETATSYSKSTLAMQQSMEKAILKLETSSKLSNTVVSDCLAGIQRLEARIDQLNKVTGGVTFSDEDISNPEKISLPSQFSSADFESELNKMIKSIGIPLVLTIYEDLSRSVQDRIIYSKIPNKKQGEQIKILKDMKKWFSEGKQPELLGYLKSQTNNTQIQARINRLIVN